MASASNRSEVSEADAIVVGVVYPPEWYGDAEGFAQ
jgi:hypothetical protein